MGHLVGRLKLDRSQSMRKKVETLVAGPSHYLGGDCHSPYPLFS